jgi:dolichol-phosphate mannosyltransferase
MDVPLTDVVDNMSCPGSYSVATAGVFGTRPVQLNDPLPDREISVSVIVPTRGEADNVGPLLERLEPAVRAMSAEIIVVDDSDDDTPAVLARRAVDCAVPVRLIHRTRATRKGGLSSAVITGARHARGVWVLVMDADLQHPPEVAAALARTAMRHDIDLVIGTRYAGSGSGEGLHGAGRAATSSSANRLVKAVFPRLLATVSDPMSGLFVFRRAAVDLNRLNPVGFKILLEILVRHPGVRTAEFAYEMAARHAGESKASLREGLAFVRHLFRLRRGTLLRQLRERPATARERVRQAVRMVTFGAVGLSGMVVNTAALWLFYDVLGVHHLLGAALATQLSTAWNFALVDGLVYRHNGNGTWRGRAVRFAAMNNVLLLARLPVLQVLVWLGLGVLVANASTLVTLFLLRFLVSDRVIYGSASQQSSRDPVRMLVDPDATAALATPARRRSQYLRYRYDVAGIVTIGSQILLPELEFFRAQWIADADVDIAVRVGDVGHRRPRRRAAMTEFTNRPTLRYEEHLGRLGANFRVELGEPINVSVGPLLARSPHVVYTNIIEALLRFVLVSRDRMLLHSACVSLGGVGVMLSALTDTGKTATVLRLLREHDARFLSDDMTVIDATGNAVCFPKPLTISAHTLRAVRATDLTPAEWRRLRVQSRLHSRGGRSIALTLSRFNLPIMSINALTQLLVPPPKYTVDRLVPCRVGSATRVEELFIIERGAPRVGELDHGTAVQRMLENTDDAYGFPPFRYLAPAITIGGAGYAELRERERATLAAFLRQVRVRVVASDTYGWADVIPTLINGGTASVNGGYRPADVPAAHRWSEVDAWPRWGAWRPAPEGQRA